MQRTRRLEPWILISAAWIIPALFAAVSQVAQGRIHGWGPASPRDILFASGDWFLYAFLTPGVFAISRRWPLSRERLSAGLFRHLAYAILFCIVWATVGKLYQFSLGLLFTPAEVYQSMARAGDSWINDLARDLLGWIFTTLPFGTAAYLCMVGIEHATRYFVESNERATQLANISAQLAEARLSSLQAQLNPHFLFNALNTIAVFVRDNDNATATRVIEELSELLRLTLNRSRGAEVPLGDEIDLVRRYLSVEEARFSDRLRPTFDVDAIVLDAAVPSFAVQHLVENAVRHGVARRTEAGSVAIRARRDGDRLEISVTDDGGFDADGNLKAGHGLENTRERLRTLYGDAASLELTAADPRGTRAVLRIPYRVIANA